MQDFPLWFFLLSYSYAFGPCNEAASSLFIQEAEYTNDLFDKIRYFFIAEWSIPVLMQPFLKIDFLVFKDHMYFEQTRTDVVIVLNPVLLHRDEVPVLQHVSSFKILNQFIGFELLDKLLKHILLLGLFVFDDCDFRPVVDIPNISTNQFVLLFKRRLSLRFR